MDACNPPVTTTVVPVPQCESGEVPTDGSCVPPNVPCPDGQTPEGNVCVPTTGVPSCQDQVCGSTTTTIQLPPPEVPTTIPTTVPTTIPPAPPATDLPATGSTTVGILAVALIMVGIGMTILWAENRR